MSHIYIGRLSYNAREKDVERFFDGFGCINDINLKNGFGFVVSYCVAFVLLSFLLLLCSFLIFYECWTFCL